MKVTQNPTPQTIATESGRAGESHATKGRDKTGHASQSNAAKGGTSIEISDDAKLLSHAAELVKSSPDIRREKVDALKKAVTDGSYKVDAGAIADKLVDEHLGSHFGKNSF